MMINHSLQKVNFNGALRVHPTNGRYFGDAGGRAIYLTGSHTWANVQEIKAAGDADFQYTEFLDMLTANHHNFMRMWQWIHPEMAPWTADKLIFSPLPYARPGPGLAQDGQPKFDLTQWNEAYFDRLRQRVIAAGERGIYVSVMFFEGWCIKNAKPVSDPWLGHPYNGANNINGVHGDADSDGKADIFSLEIPEIVEVQKAFVRKVVDTLNDQDHLIWEILNEIANDERGLHWHYAMIDYVHDYEKSRPKQHPVGMTAEGGSQDNTLLFASNADWISPGAGLDQEYKYNPPASDGRKVILTDTDHIWGHGGHYVWAWKSCLRGLNPLFMDPWQPIPGQPLHGFIRGDDLNTRDYPAWEPLRRNLGYVRRYVERMNLAAAAPHNNLASTGYCLANPGAEYLVYLPEGGGVRVNLTAATGELAVEWFNPRTGETMMAEPVIGGSRQELFAPFAGDAVLFI
ncbi:MAG: DUF6298 domain-containing protein, partial [Chloroflexota bacterium]|nr:DUF6298 domain-containing protein [Chloroflexota bacterium]